MEDRDVVLDDDREYPVDPRVQSYLTVVHSAWVPLLSLSRYLCTTATISVFSESGGLVHTIEDQLAGVTKGIGDLHEQGPCLGRERLSGRPTRAGKEEEVL